MKLAPILFAHGACDTRWFEPFERIAAAAPDLPVELGFLEFMTPGLATATDTLVAAGATRIRIVPLYFGQGGHLRNDVPAMVADIGASLPGVSLELARAADNDDGVVAALVAFCLGEARKG
ncbi:MAG: CbiX/SirB N-terminal domain-containing protein [Casimicrobiaceae bacterium]